MISPKPTYEELLKKAEAFDKLEAEYNKLKDSFVSGTNYLEKLNDSLNEAIFTVKLPDYTIGYMNAGVERVFGYSVEECVGRTTEFLYPSNLNYVEFGEKLQCAIDEKKEPYKSEQMLVKKNGETFPAETITTFIHDKDEITHVISIVRDITERKAAEEALRESEKRFRTLAENIEEVFWIGSPDWTEVFYISPAYEKIWGRSCKELLQNPLSWLEAVIEEDRNPIEKYIQEKARGNFEEIVFPEYRILRPDGEQRWIFARGFPIRNDSGEVFRIVGTAVDVTLRKNMEIKLMESKETARALLDASIESCFLVEKDGTYIDMNEVAARRLGKRIKDLIGKNFTDSLPAEVASSRMAVLEQINQNREPIRLEDRRSGFIFDTNVSPILDSEGNVKMIAVYSKDITAQKRMEENLLIEKEKLEKAIEEVKKLSGLLPICASCKKIRDDKGYWRQIENYIRDHSEARFSHSICPECCKRLYPDLD